MPVIPHHRLTATLATVALLSASCGSVGSGPIHFAPAAKVDTVDKLRRAIRHAAYARVAARAGEYAEAYAAYRAALALHADAAWSRAAAEAAERAGFPGESRDNWLLTARLVDDPDARKHATEQAERVEGTMPVDATRVAVVVVPAGARIELYRDNSNEGRPVIGDDAVWLLPGTWRVEDPETLEPGGVTTMRIGPNGPRTIAVHLRRDGAPVPPPEPRRVVRPKPDPATTPGEQTDPHKVVEGPKPDPEQPAPNQPNPQGPVVGPEQPDPAPLPGKPSRGIHGWGPYALAGLGVAAIGGGAFLGKLAFDYADIANGLDETSGRYQENLTFYGDGAKNYALFANVAFAAGGLLIAGGAAWYFLRRVPRATVHLDAAGAPEASQLTFGFDGRSVSARWSF